jgi:hypothetical protein
MSVDPSWESHQIVWRKFVLIELQVLVPAEAASVVKYVPRQRGYGLNLPGREDGFQKWKVDKCEYVGYNSRVKAGNDY